MSRINDNSLKIIEANSNFIKYENKKALFNTKIASSMRHNGEIVEVIGVLKGRDEEHDAYIVRFNDDTIESNIMNVELVFDYARDNDDITKLELLNEIKEMTEHNIMAYSADYMFREAKHGFETEFARENKKLILIEEMIREAKEGLEQEEKQKKKSKSKGAR